MVISPLFFVCGNGASKRRIVGLRSAWAKKENWKNLEIMYKCRDGKFFQKW
jgi:hypothetical protein